MYSLVFGENFLSSVKKLDIKLKRKINSQLKILQQNPFHSRLHTKPLHGQLAEFHSLRIGRDYRLVFKFTNNKTLLLVAVEHRSKVYK